MPFIGSGGSAIVTVPAGQKIIIGSSGDGQAIISYSSAPSNFPPSYYEVARLSNTSATYGTFPADEMILIDAPNASSSRVEYVVGAAPVLTNAIYNPTVTQTLTIAGTPATLTNPTLQATNSVNDYTQISIQNKSAGANASADLIAYPDNVTSSDLTGFADVGMTSSGFAQAAYTVTGQNEAYLFGSAPSGASKSGSLVIATDSTGTNNNIEFFVTGFNKAKTAYSARIKGTSGIGAGLTEIKEGLALTGKLLVANGAATTYTVPAKTNYVYLTSSAASLAFTFPQGNSGIDGIVITVCVSISIATVTWASTSATFVGAPASLVANVPVSFIYHSATTQWLPT
jgi:hypothetical protein